MPVDCFRGSRPSEVVLAVLCEVAGFAEALEADKRENIAFRIMQASRPRKKTETNHEPMNHEDSRLQAGVSTQKAHQSKLDSPSPGCGEEGFSCQEHRDRTADCASAH